MARTGAAAQEVGRCEEYRAHEEVAQCKFLRRQLQAVQSKYLRGSEEVASSSLPLRNLQTAECKFLSFLEIDEKWDSGWGTRWSPCAARVAWNQCTGTGRKISAKFWLRDTTSNPTAAVVLPQGRRGLTRHVDVLVLVRHGERQGRRDARTVSGEGRADSSDGGLVRLPCNSSKPQLLANAPARKPPEQGKDYCNRQTDRHEYRGAWGVRWKRLQS